MQLKSEHVKALIDEPYRSRGNEYFQEGMVQLISVASNCVKARVVGTRVYQVALTLRNSTLNGNCTCPAYEDFGPCKHMAATAFAVMASQNQGYQASAQCASQVNEYDHFEKFLRKKTKAELITLILQLSDDYPEVMEEVQDFDM